MVSRAFSLLVSVTMLAACSSSSDSTTGGSTAGDNEANGGGDSTSSDGGRDGSSGETPTKDGGAMTPDDSCTALTAEPYENNEGNDAEFTAKFFPTNDRDDEYIDMFFRSAASGTFAYGQGKNADLYTCDQCMLIVRNGKNFYPTEGTIMIVAGSEPMKKKLQASLSLLKLVEITIDDDYHSIPVAGGECVTLAPATIDVDQ